MKKHLLLSFIFLQAALTNAQTFSNTDSTHIKDTATICLPITVAGLQTRIDTSFGITSSCFKINNSDISNLVINLIAPDSSEVHLLDGIGYSTEYFTNTCVAENGAGGHIEQGSSPFTGTYIPMQSINILNNGKNPNGTWNFCVSNTYFTDTGTVHNCSITFGNSPPKDPPPAIITCTFCICPNGTGICDLLPDMTSSALCIQQDHAESPGSFVFGNATPNIGSGPMEIHGLDSCFCDSVRVPCYLNNCPAGHLHQVITQRIYHRNNSDTLTYYDHIAGTMTFHPAHGHLHVDHWADYSLRMATPDPNATKWPIVGTSNKQSFCLVNLGDCTSSFGYCKDSLGANLTQANIPNSNFGFYTGCGLDQGIYPGDLDIYDSSLNDPMDINDLCNGKYYVVSITDPKNYFLEERKDNNWVATPVTFSLQKTALGIASFNYNVNASQVTFTNTSPAGTTYLWNFGDGSWDTTASPVHNYSGASSYTVTLVSLNQCYKMKSQGIVTTGINKYEYVDLNLNVYPNPFSTTSEISYYLPENSNVRLEVTDLPGRKVRVLLNETQTKGAQHFTFDDQKALPSGTYFLILTTNYGRNTVKLMKLE